MLLLLLEKEMPLDAAVRLEARPNVGDDAVGGGPDHGLRVPLTGGHIGEGGLACGGGHPGQTAFRALKFYLGFLIPFN